MSRTLVITIDDDTDAKLVRLALINEGRASAAGLCAARILANVLPEALERAEHVRRLQRIQETNRKAQG